MMTILCIHCLVALAQRLFPMEARVAMANAQMKEKSDFIVTSVDPDCLTGAKRTSPDRKKSPLEIIEEQRSRLKALSKTGMESPLFHLLLLINK